MATILKSFSPNLSDQWRFNLDMVDRECDIRHPHRFCNVLSRNYVVPPSGGHRALTLVWIIAAGKKTKGCEWRFQ